VVLLLIIIAISLCIISLHQYWIENSSHSQVSRLVRENDQGNSDDPSPKPVHHRWNGGATAKTIYQVYQTDMTNDLLMRIEDLRRIKFSINNELRLLESEKVKLLREKASLASKNEKLSTQINRSKFQLKQLELDLSASRKRKFEQNCDSERISPIVFKPLESVDIDLYSISSQFRNYDHLKSPNTTKQDRHGFDFSRCPLTKEFKFHLWRDEPVNESKLSVSLASLAREILLKHNQHTNDAKQACLILSLAYQDTDLGLEPNVLVLNLDKDDNINQNLMRGAAIASSSFQENSFRDKIDLVLPNTWRPPVDFDSILGSLPSQSPTDRKYLVSYFGLNGHDVTRWDEAESKLDYLSSLERILQVIHRNSLDDLFLFIYSCGPSSKSHCYEERDKMIEMSTFLIILPSTEDIDHNTNDLIYLSLSRGTIPVIFGKERTRLPFDEVIDWTRAALLLPTARLSEFHLILRSISPADLYQLKYHGRHVFLNHLATAKQILDTAISIMSLNRFNYPPPPIQNIETIDYYDSQERLIDTNCTMDSCLDSKSESLTGLFSTEILGPREKPLASGSFNRNFSLVLTASYELWNNPMYSPFQLFPSLPNDPLLPSEYKFITSDSSFRPIGDGLGGSGFEFSRSLGGDFPNEQFTVILLTFERKSMLMKILERLKGVPFMNKILVVWNGVNHKPPADLVWPDVGVPIVVVKVDQNSLNNRFLPYDAIETDAILSLDDDSPLRPDEIVFAFRVWRQSRDRIVGFPGRYHAWDGVQSSWMYNSNHSCELSMVLTGGAFFHRHYSYLYTYSMPSVIRSIVDKFMNCEDIAMNFLVAHLTRKPPIKVTSRWTFHCANCPSSLSEDESHFRERHECLNTFASIYGYMPLLNTQHRSDSVLFKTRLPHDKQKCFKFV